MFNLIQRAYQQSKPFLSSSYQATSSGITAGLYTLKAGAHIVVAAAYTSKAAVKTAYYSVKHFISVTPAAYNYYTAETPNPENSDSFQSLHAAFWLEHYTHTYNQNWAAAAEDFSSTAHTFAEEVYPPLSDTAASFGQVFSNTWGCLGHTFKATGEGLLLVKDAAEYCLSDEQAQPCIADDYELIEKEEAADAAAPAA